MFHLRILIPLPVRVSWLILETMLYYVISNECVHEYEGYGSYSEWGWVSNSIMCLGSILNQ